MEDNHVSFQSLINDDGVTVSKMMNGKNWKSPRIVLSRGLIRTNELSGRAIRLYGSGTGEAGGVGGTTDRAQESLETAALSVSQKTLLARGERDFSHHTTSQTLARFGMEKQIHHTCAGTLL